MGCVKRERKKLKAGIPRNNFSGRVFFTCAAASLRCFREQAVSRGEAEQVNSVSIPPTLLLSPLRAIRLLQWSGLIQNATDGCEFGEKGCCSSSGKTGVASQAHRGGKAASGEGVGIDPAGVFRVSVLSSIPVLSRLQFRRACLFVSSGKGVRGTHPRACDMRQTRALFRGAKAAGLVLLLCCLPHGW